MADNVATATKPTEAAPAKKDAAGQDDVHKKGTASVEFWPTAEKAVEVAKSREKGARRAFQVELGGKTRYCTANHVHFVTTKLIEEQGGKVNEIGKPPRQAGPVGLDAIMAAVNGLPEDEKNKVLEQLKALSKKK